jgi:hypothetical protein
MLTRQASLLVADEIYYNLYGKAILQGIYGGDLTIGSDPSFSPQLIFYFMMETDMSEPFQTLAIEVTLPNSQPIRNVVGIMPPELARLAGPGRTRFFYRHPLLVQAPILKPGKIEAKVIHEKGEIVVGAPWIALNPATTPNPN